jgi:hypothetical protein
MAWRSSPACRLVLLIVLGLIGSATWASGALAYPFTTRSYYEHSPNTTTLYNQGCNAGQSGANGIAILDFGRPAYSGGAYGTIDFNGNFDSSAAIRAAVKSYASGFWDCTPINGPFMTIAIGTNNSYSNHDQVHCPNGCGSQPPSFTEAGNIWAYSVKALNDYINAPPSFASQENGAAADDMEPAWEPPYTYTQNFVSGYNNSAVATDALYDYGSLESGYWTSSQEYYVAYGALFDYPIPEIYYCCQQTAWENLSLWGTSNGNYGTIYFPGVMSQYRSGYSCGYTPHESYDRLLAALQSHTSTYQSSLPWITNIVCNT